MSELSRLIEFLEEAQVNNARWVKKREPARYGTFIVFKCAQENWWYNKFIGVKFFGMIEKNDIKPVRLMGTKRVEGRGLLPADCILE